MEILGDQDAGVDIRIHDFRRDPGFAGSFENRQFTGSVRTDRGVAIRMQSQDTLPAGVSHTVDAIGQAPLEFFDNGGFTVNPGNPGKCRGQVERCVQTGTAAGC